jgi:hypothetical protein
MDKVSLNDLEEQTGHVMKDENLRNLFAQRYADHAVKRKEHDVVQTQSHPAGISLVVAYDGISSNRCQTPMKPG